jgi:hypothetical protein
MHGDEHAVAALPGRDDMGAVDAEDLIGPGSPGRAGPTRSVSHVRILRRFASSLPMEGPDLLLRPRHADPAYAGVRCTDAPIRRATLTSDKCNDVMAAYDCQALGRR